MYFNKSFTLKKTNYKTWKDFEAIVKHYLKRYKNNTDIIITVGKGEITFTGKGNVCFY